MSINFSLFDSGTIQFWSFVSEGDAAALVSLKEILGDSLAGEDSGLSCTGGLNLSVDLGDDVLTVLSS